MLLILIIIKMKYQSVLALFSVIGIASGKDWVSNPNVVPRKYQGKSVEELRKVFNLQHPPRDQYFHKPSLMNAQNASHELPTHFSWRVNASECMTPRIDQGECGSCYAHATSSMLAERLCIHENGKHKAALEPLSPNYIMSCDAYAYGCNGGMIS